MPEKHFRRHASYAVMQGVDVQKMISNIESRKQAESQYVNDDLSGNAEGEDEIKSGKPKLRNLGSGEEKSIAINGLVNEIKKII